MEIKLKENSKLAVKDHSGNSICSIDEAVKEGAGKVTFNDRLEVPDTRGWAANKTIATEDYVDDALSEIEISLNGKTYKASGTVIELPDLAEPDGYYWKMKVGLADNLATSVDNDESAAFTFRSSGGNADIRADISTGPSTVNYLYGNTIAWNQLVKNGNFEYNTGWVSNHVTLSVSNNTATIVSQEIGTNGIYTHASPNAILGHKYLVMYTAWASAPISCGYGYGGLYRVLAFDVGTSPKLCAEIFTPNSTDNVFYIYTYRNTETFYVKGVRLFDLTLMFGAGKEPTTVEEFNRLFQNTYYEYNAGTLMSCKSSAYKTVGYNAFDGELEQGGIYPDGENVVNSNVIRAKNWIQVIPGQTYTAEISDDAWNGKAFFYGRNVKNDASTGRLIISNTSKVSTLVIPNDIHFIRFSLPNNASVPSSNKCAFHLTWSGSRTGYEKHVSYTYGLPNIELRSAGNAFDELRPDGTLVRRIGVVDMGTMAWGEISNGKMYTDSIASVIKQNTNYNGYPNLVCAKYSTDKPSNMASSSPNDKTISVGGNGVTVIVCDNDYADATAFKQAMSGVYLFYELATPTTVTDVGYEFAADTYINDYGTQEFISDQVIQVPQGLSMEYNLGLRDFLQRLYIKADGDAPSVAIGPNIPIPPTSGTYVLKSVNGVISWVAE